MTTTGRITETESTLTTIRREGSMDDAYSRTTKWTEMLQIGTIRRIKNTVATQQAPQLETRRTKEHK